MINNYILAYYQAMRDGTQTVGAWILGWYTFIVKGLEKKLFFYDAKKAHKAIRFIENYCHHHEGNAAPGTIKLQLWQKALTSVIFGVLDKDNLRQFRQVVIIIARKNGKTLFAAAIAAYMLYMDGEYGARVYFCAPKLDQSRICYDGLYQMILKQPDMSEITKRRRTDIYIAQSNSSAMAIPFSAKRADGLNPHLCVADEIASWQGDAGLKQYEVLRSALGARKQPMILSISTAGYVNDGIYDELIKRSTAVINGTSSETRLAPFLYMIDDPDKWNDLQQLKKSNPNLGVSVSVDYMLQEIAIAENSLSKLAEFKTKYCNIKQSSSLSWMSAQTIERCFGNNYTLQDFRGSYAIISADLSNCGDLTACMAMIQREGVVYFFTHFFIPAAKLEQATARDGVPYSQYIKQGWLSLSGENNIDYHDCFQWFKRLVQDYEIYPLICGYDRWNSLYWCAEMQAYGFHMDSVRQGTNLTGIINNTQGMIRDGKLQCADNNSLMKIHMLDSALKTDAETNLKKLIKVHKQAHVDGMAALLDAMCMRQAHWQQIGNQLTNAG